MLEQVGEPEELARKHCSSGKLQPSQRVARLPLRLKVQQVSPQANGLQFTAGASNITLNSSGL